MLKASDMRNLTISKTPHISSLIKEYEKNIRESAEKGNFSYSKRDEETDKCEYIADYFKKLGYKASWYSSIRENGKYSDITIQW